jgi:hypothetical protein
MHLHSELNSLSRQFLDAIKALLSVKLVRNLSTECRFYRVREPYRIDQGWPNSLNVRATYDKLQMFESRKT